MESQPQNPEFRINPENFHPCNLFTSAANTQVRFRLDYISLKQAI